MDAPRDIRTPKCNQTFCTKFSQLCIRIKSRGGKTRTYCVARGTLLNVMWQPGGEWGLGEKGYVDMYGWVHVSAGPCICCPPVTITTLLTGYTPTQNEKVLKK